MKSVFWLGCGLLVMYNLGAMEDISLSDEKAGHEPRNSIESTAHFASDDEPKEKDASLENFLTLVTQQLENLNHLNASNKGQKKENRNSGHCCCTVQ